MTLAAWHLLAPEYPPRLGGVADYTDRVAGALAAAGEGVDVWAPGPGESTPGVRVHALGGLSPARLGGLERALRESAGRARLFVQYVPTSLGLRGMNVPLVRWLVRQKAELWVQFHEVALGFAWRRRPDLHLTHAVQLWMARALARRADRVFVSIEAWRARLGPDGARATWLPIPSNVPTEVGAAELARARASLGPGPWVGHFGTFGEAVSRELSPALRALAKGGRARLLLVGRGAGAFASGLGLAERVQSEESLGAELVSARLAACDVLLQPFPDGISTRRTSAMAGLALGVPVVTTDGALTDAIWRTSDAVALEPVGRPDRLAARVLALLDDPDARRGLADRGAALYRARFSLERTLETLGAAFPGGRVPATP